MDIEKSVKALDNVKVAVCIPTYNRPDVIQEYIENTVFRYLRHNFDIFIYDSSEDKLTEEIVKKGMQQYTGLHYRKVDSSIHSNRKVYNIFMEFGSRQEYDYLWVCSDYIRWTEFVLDSVRKYIEKKYDIIIPNYQDVEKIGNKEYVDINALFLDCAWHMTLFGATILRVSTMLNDINWNGLVERYMVPDCINHSHVAFYFEKLAAMKGWKAVHLSFSKSDMIVSSMRKYSGWHKDCWPTMINKLPECYKNKKRVIKKIGVNSGILSYQNLKKLKRQKIFNKEVYRCYKSEWHNLTNIPRLFIWGLSIIPPELIDWEEYRKEILLKKRIKKFCQKHDHIYIYGAGRKADRYTGYLNELGIPFEAYLVSEQVDNVKIKENHKVVQFYKELLHTGNVGILLALNEENTKEVMEKMELCFYGENQISSLYTDI